MLALLPSPDSEVSVLLADRFLMLKHGCVYILAEGAAVDGFCPIINVAHKISYSFHGTNMKCVIYA